MALSRIVSTSSGGTSPLRSTSSSCGYSSLVTKACTVCTIDCCSSSSSKSMCLLSFSRTGGPAGAHRPAGVGRPGKYGVRLPDRRDPLQQVLRQVRRATRGGVDVDEQLLSGGEDRTGLPVQHLLVEMDPPGVVVQQLQGQRQRLTLRGLSPVAQTGLRGVQGVA